MSNKIRWQCRRGMLELDFIFQRFFETRYSALSLQQQNAFEQLLKQDDPILFDWLITGVPCPDVALQEMVDMIGRRPMV
ncbi:MAG: succinate dehydrogenase assembly factor 2 [Coxiellaceae bacterium]|nr:succinate dehydrogenase assembly factor 2 [Coxiellaceae bacterium]